jgi:hypothetical protein
MPPPDFTRYKLLEIERGAIPLSAGIGINIFTTLLG